MSEISNELIMEAYELHKKYGSFRKAAKVSGISRDALSRRFNLGLARGLFGPYEHEVMSGLEIREVKTVYDKNKNIVSNSIRMAAESGEITNADLTGLKIKGASILKDGAGNERLIWEKYGEKELSLEEKIDIVKNAFGTFKVPKFSLSRPTLSDADRLTVYPVLDWHLNMYATKEATGDIDWDLDKAVKVISESFVELLQTTPNSDTAIIMCLGDLLHNDNSKNRTERSNNTLDVSNYHSKALNVACELLMFCIEKAAEKHDNVIVAVKRGNHDDMSTVAIHLALKIRYKDHPRIKIEDTENMDFFYYRFGCNYIAGTHGDKQKSDMLVFNMANERKEYWAKTSTRHFFTGHIHHETSKEIGGVTIFSLRAPIPKDAYHSGVGYVSGRSLYSFSYHKEKGNTGRTIVELK